MSQSKRIEDLMDLLTQSNLAVHRLEGVPRLTKAEFHEKITLKVQEALAVCEAIEANMPI